MGRTGQTHHELGGITSLFVFFRSRFHPRFNRYRKYSVELATTIFMLLKRRQNPREVTCLSSVTQRTSSGATAGQGPEDSTRRALPPCEWVVCPGEG